MSEFFKSNLKYLRTKKGLSQNKLGQLIGVNQTTIARWEDNNRVPTIDNAIDVANALNITLSDLLSKDLRIEENQTNEKKQFSEEEKKEALKQVLKDKGFLNENEEISKDDVDKLIDFAKRNKDYIIDKKEER